MRRYFKILYMSAFIQWRLSLATQTEIRRLFHFWYSGETPFVAGQKLPRKKLKSRLFMAARRALAGEPMSERILTECFVVVTDDWEKYEDR